jgi:uncharacterized repeat protein (TIGR01451 family)
MHRKVPFTLLLLLAILASAVPAALVQAQGPVTPTNPPVAPAGTGPHGPSLAVQDPNPTGAEEAPPAESLPAEPDSGWINAILREGFDGSTFPPTNWGQTPIVGTSVWDRQAFGTNPPILPHSGGWIARWNSYNITSGNQTRLYTLIFSLAGTTAPVARFYMSHDNGYSTYNDNIQPQISTDGGSTWTNLGAPIPRYNAAYTLPGWGYHITSLAAYIGQTNVRFGFLATSAMGNNIFLDDVVIGDPEPAFDASRKAAPLWVQQGSPITYTVSITNSGDGIGTGTRMTDTIPAGTTYRAGSVWCSAGTCSYDTGNNRILWNGDLAVGAGAQVRFAVDTGSTPCGNVVNTAQVRHAASGAGADRSARTQVAVTTPTLYEGFDATTFPPLNWTTTVVTTGVTLPAWSRMTTGILPLIAPRTGAAMAQINTYSASATSSNRLATPVLSFSGMVAPRLLFWMSQSSASSANYDRIQVQISTDGGTTWAKLGEPFYRYDSTCSTPCWKQKGVDLAVYVGQTNVRVGFLGISAYGQNINLDDVSVGEAWFPCPSVIVQPDASVAGTCRGSTSTQPFTVQNASSIADTLNLSASGNTWPVTFNPASLTLGPGQKGTVNVDIYVPWTASSPDADATNVIATAQGSGLVGQSAAQTDTGPNNGYSDYLNLNYYRRTRDHSLVYYNGKLFKFGGYDNAAAAAGARDYTYIYDIATNTWSNGAAMPGVRYWIDCVEIDGLIYCAGGYATSGQATLYIYNPATNTWGTGAALPAYRYAYAGVALGGLYYVIGGYISGGPTNTMIIYNPATNTWSNGPNMAQNRRYPSAGVIGGKIYVAGGFVDVAPTPTRVTEVYDPGTNSWGTFALFPATDPQGNAINGWARAADGVIEGRYLIMAGGYSVDGTASPFAIAYDQGLDQWFWLTYLDHSWYSAEGDTDANGDFWFASGRIYEGALVPWNYGRYVTKMGGWCGTCAAITNPGLAYSPPAPFVGDTVAFTGTVAGGAAPVQYAWDLGDGNTAAGQYVQHAYADFGTYTVLMTATNCDALNVLTATTTLTVYAPDVVVTPDSLAAEQCPDTTTTQTLSICNTGNDLLHWSISELSGTGRLAVGAPHALAQPTGPRSGGDITRPAGAPQSWTAPNAACVVAVVAGPDPESTELHNTLTEFGFTWVDVTTVQEARDAGADVIIDRFAVNGNLPVGDVNAWLNEGHGFIHMGDWPQWFPTSWEGATAGTPLAITVDDPAHPLTQGLPPSWTGLGFWAYGWPGSNAVGWVTDSSYPDIIQASYGTPHQRVISAAEYGTGRAVYIGINTYGYLAGDPDKLVLRNALSWSGQCGETQPVDVPWLSEAPITGTVPVSQCQDVVVAFDSTGLNSGDYFARLLITSDDPDTPLITVPVTLTVDVPTAAAFQFSAPNCLGSPVVFTNTTVGTNLTYLWSFGDGITSTAANPTHVYAAAGDYAVTLTASGACGTSVAAHTVVVSEPTVAGFTSNTPVCLGTDAVFTNTSTGTSPAFLWSFGDGGTSTETNPIHTYATAGDFTVDLLATNSCGQSSAQQTFHVFAPIANAGFTWMPPTPLVNEDVTFTATASSELPLTYAWAFGDGNTGSGPVVVHAYAAAGNYDVVLTVSDGCGSVVVTDTVTVVSGCVAPAGAFFTWLPITPTAGANVDFSASVLTGTSPLTFDWQFSDGGTDSGQNVAHVFATPGTYAVTMTVANGCGNDTMVHTVVVAGVCAPVTNTAFTWNPPTPLVGEDVTLDGTADGTLPIAFAWALGDGATGSGATVVHAYAAPGDYEVILTATNGCGEQTVLHTVTVVSGCVAPAGAFFTWLPLNPAPGQQVDFHGTLEAGTSPLTFTWAFGDSGTATGQDAVHTYAAAGAYTVTLTVANPCGQDTATYVVTVSTVQYTIYLPIITKNY